MRFETTGACPLCQSTARTLLHADVEDEVHRAVPGRFTLWRCRTCSAGYLDPRPVAEDIGQAYAGYHTHGQADDAFALPKTRLGRFRRAARNAYVNARYGYDAQPAAALGGALLALSPLRFGIDHWVHRLPARPGGRLLDVGCGNGGWLAQMRHLGWTVEGVDFDPDAVRAARGLGLTVHAGGIEAVTGRSYDAIALNHVLEHVHDPVALLRACRALLAPGGDLWIATPNLAALGHRLYGASWRGIEAPRHLVLFTERALGFALAAAGFPPAVALRTRAWGKEHFPHGHRVRAMVADVAGLISPRWQEELCVRVTAR